MAALQWPVILLKRDKTGRLRSPCCAGANEYLNSDLHSCRERGVAGKPARAQASFSLPSFVTQQRGRSVLLAEVKGDPGRWFGCCCRQIPGWTGSEGFRVNLENGHFCITQKPARSPSIFLVQPRGEKKKEIL